MEVALLGPLEVTVQGRRVAIGAAKQRAVLALLALRASRPVRAGALVEALWGEDPPPTAAKTLQTYVAALRRKLPPRSIETVPGGYLLNVGPQAVDAARFTRLAGLGGAATRDAAARAKALEDALNMWRGPPLPDLADGIAGLEEAARLEEVRRVAEEDLAEARLALGQHHSLVADLEAAVAREPLRERRWAQLVLALYRSGRQADALRAYQRLRTTLGEELGIGPSSELVTLERAVLAQAPELDPPVLPFAAPQEEAVGSEPLPVQSPEPGAPNLPVQLSSFWGRSAELALGAKLLASARLLTVTGGGGTGKTRLAYQLAAEASGQFPDGVWAAELAPVSAPGLVSDAVMSALGLRDEPSRSPTETVVAHLSGRQALLVLDNCEHVIEAAAALATAVLKGCPAVRALATSREPLRVEGETIWPLRPLALPSRSARTAAALATSDAVGLFCERAAEARVGFGLDDANAITVAEICNRLDGIPLALELAAARLGTLPLAELARRLAQDIGLLSKAPRGAHSRQASLEATLDWSHKLLSLPEQVLFRRLAVFAGGFDLGSAEAVCDGGDLDGELLDALDGLVDKSLVSLSPERAVEGRYRLLEPVRGYADNRLGIAGERGFIAERHAAYFARLAQEIREQATLGASPAGWEADHPNFLAALDHLSATGAPLAHGRMVVDLWDFWSRLGHWRIGEREYRRYLARPEGDPVCRAASTRYLGNLANFLGDLTEARYWHEEALRLARELGDRRAEVACLRNCGNDSFTEGDFGQARAFYGEALAIAREGSERTIEGLCVGGLGLASGGQGDWRAAWEFFSEALAMAQEVGDRFNEATWLRNRGSTAVALGRYAEAKEDLLAALLLSDELGDRKAQINSRTYLGDLATSLGDHPGSRGYYEEALKLAQLTGGRRDGSWAEGGLGVLALKLGDYAEAERHLRAAHTASVEASDKAAQAQWLGWLAALDLGQGDRAGAATRCAQAMAIAGEIGQEDGFLLEVAAGVLALTGQYSQAAEILGVADEVNAKVGKKRSAWDQGRYDATLARCADVLGPDRLSACLGARGPLDWADAVSAALSALAEH